MTATDIKKELHKYIDDADDRILKILYGMILADKQSHEIPHWHKEVIEERLEQYYANPMDVITLEEMKEKVLKLKK